VSELLQGKDADWWANRMIPPNHNYRRYTEEFLAEHWERKGTMFFWKGSPQGHDYWARLTPDSPYLEEARSFLRWLLRGNIKDDELE
jgi:hypothetical protein